MGSLTHNGSSGFTAVRQIVLVQFGSSLIDLLGGFEIGNAPDTDVRPVVERSISTGEPVIIVTPNYRLSGRDSALDLSEIPADLYIPSIRVPRRQGGG